MQKGIYALLVHLSEPKDIHIGALGTIPFKQGWYIYTGSALGSGGLSRVSRHIRFYHDHYRKPKWHIDYLMEAATLKKTICAVTEERLECVLAKAISGACVLRFGCSDCDCPSHLFYREDEPSTEILNVFRGIGLSAVVHDVV